MLAPVKEKSSLYGKSQTYFNICVHIHNILKKQSASRGTQSPISSGDTPDLDACFVLVTPLLGVASKPPIRHDSKDLENSNTNAWVQSKFYLACACLSVYSLISLAIHEQNFESNK